MFDRWRSTEYVRETTEIVRLKLDPGNNYIDPGLIVPNRRRSFKTLPGSRDASKETKPEPGPPTV